MRPFRPASGGSYLRETKDAKPKLVERTELDAAPAVAPAAAPPSSEPAEADPVTETPAPADEPTAKPARVAKKKG